MPSYILDCILESFKRTSAQHPDSLASSASMNAVITFMHSTSAVNGTLLAGEEDAGGEEEH
jgi:hypothetical protein